MELHFIENNEILQFKDENQTISNIYNFKLYQYSKIFTQFKKKLNYIINDSFLYYIYNKI